MHPTDTAHTDIKDRLETFYVELICADLDQAESGRISDLATKVRQYLLGPDDKDVRVHQVRTVREAERLPDKDVVIYDDGTEQGIYWHRVCLRL